MSVSDRHVTPDLLTPSDPGLSGAESPGGLDMDFSDSDRVSLPVPVLFQPAPTILSCPTQTWTEHCECGGIEPHTHRTTMNGAAGNGETTLTSTVPQPPTTRRNGRMPNYVQVAKSYVFEQEIQLCLKQTGVSQAREDSIRLAGVQWIDNVRRALKL